MKIMKQVRAKENPQHFLSISPEQHLSRNTRMCPMIQVNKVNNVWEETIIYFMAIHNLGHKALLFLSIESWWRHQHCPTCFVKIAMRSLVSIHIQVSNLSGLGEIQTGQVLIYHLKGVISSISLTYNAAPDMSICIHLTMRHDTHYFLTHRQDNVSNAKLFLL